MYNLGTGVLYAIESLHIYATDILSPTWEWTPVRQVEHLIWIQQLAEAWYQLKSLVGQNENQCFGRWNWGRRRGRGRSKRGRSKRGWWWPGSRHFWHWQRWGEGGQWGGSWRAPRLATLSLQRIKSYQDQRKRMTEGSTVKIMRIWESRKHQIPF